MESAIKKALEAELEANVHDIDTWLVYADWLEEQGDRSCEDARRVAIFLEAGYEIFGDRSFNVAPPDANNDYLFEFPGLEVRKDYFIVDKQFMEYLDYGNNEVPSKGLLDNLMQGSKMLIEQYDFLESRIKERIESAVT